MLLLQIFKDQFAPPSALLAACLKHFGTECLEWEPELLRKEVEDDYGIKLSDLQSDKLQAAIILLTTDSFECRWEVFEKCCLLCNNIPVDMELLDPLDVEDIMAGICEAVLIRHEKIEYHDEVNAYAGIVFYEYGMSEAPMLMSSALLPKAHPSDDKEKNEALQELFDSHLKRTTEYLQSIE